MAVAVPATAMMPSATVAVSATTGLGFSASLLTWYSDASSNLAAG
jgi:hypothetical protein